MMIAVVGPGRPGSDDDTAEAVGRNLATAGATVVCGGLGGVMEAACRGARQVDGTTVGILPGTDRSAANPYVSIAIPSGLGEARNTLVVRAAQAVIAVEGAYGTLSEIAFALKTGVPVIGLGTWRLIRGDGVTDTGVHHEEEPRAAVELALTLAREHG